MKQLIILLFSVFLLQVNAQTDRAKAEQGDGIFSLLRKNGLDPVKYYADFLELNKGRLKINSELVVNELYVLPNAPDSFKNRGMFIAVDSLKETPIFKGDLSKMKLEDSTLQNVIYYLLDTRNSSPGISSGSDFSLALAEKLLSKGAKVYLLKNPNIYNFLNYGQTESIGSLVGNTVSVINQYYIKNHGSYQKVLFIEDTGKENEDIDISMKSFEIDKATRNNTYNYGDSVPVINNFTFNDDAIAKRKEKLNVYLATNLLPPVNSIVIGGKVEKSIENYNSINLLLQGIEKDYTSLQFKD